MQAGIFRPALQEFVGDDDEIGASRDPLEFRAERPSHQRIWRFGIAQVPGVVEIDHHGKRTEHGPCYPTGDPRQHLLLDPYDIELAGLDEVMQALGIERQDTTIEGRRPS